MAVYGYGKMHAQLVAQGWDPAGVGRDRVMNIMRGLGIRGVRRGRTPVTTKPAKGTGGRPDLVDGRFEACAPNRLHVAGITYVRMANGSFGCTAFADGVYARRIVGWACAMTMNTQELPLQALGQAISWAASRGGADGLIRHGDHGTQCTGTVYTTGVMEYGMLPSTGTVGDSCDNACTGPWATGHPKRWKPSIINIKRHKPPRYKDGTKIRPLHIACLEGNGDFRSPECVELLDEADIVVTNPPFSLFREYIAQLMEHDKKFVVIGNQNAVTYKEVFPLIKENRIWLGCYSGNMEFRVPGDYEAHSENDK